MIELYFSTVKILAQRPTHVSAVATILLRERERERERETGPKRQRQRGVLTHSHLGLASFKTRACAGDAFVRNSHTP